MWQVKSLFCSSAIALIFVSAPFTITAQTTESEQLHDAVRAADKHFSSIRLLNKLYNRDFLSAMGRNIVPEKDFKWRWLNNFGADGNEALLVIHTNTYGCGMYLCSADIWVGDAGSPVRIGDFSLADGEDIEVLERTLNEYPIVIAGSRAYAFSPKVRHFVDLNELQNK